MAVGRSELPRRLDSGWDGIVGIVVFKGYGARGKHEAVGLGWAWLGSSLRSTSGLDCGRTRQGERIGVGVVLTCPGRLSPKGTKRAGCTCCQQHPPHPPHPPWPGSVLLGGGGGVTFSSCWSAVPRLKQTDITKHFGHFLFYTPRNEAEPQTLGRHLGRVGRRRGSRWQVTHFT